MASMDFGGAFDTLADDEYWLDAVMVFVGFVAPVVIANIVESQMDQDLPNEIYGVVVIAAAEVIGDYRMVSVGGGVYTADALAQRAGIKQRVTNLGGN